MQKVPFFTSLKSASAGPELTAGTLIVMWAGLMFSKALVSIAVVAALIFWVLWRFQARDWRIRADFRILGILLAFLFWVTLSFFWSEAQAQSLKGIKKTAEHILIFLLVADVFQSQTSLRKWEKSFLIIALIVIFDGWFQYLTGKDLIRGFASQPSGSGVRLSACFNTYGLFAAYLISTLPLLAGLAMRFWKENNKKYTAAFTAAFFSSLPLLYLTRSRGAILAAVIGFFIFLLYRRYFIQFAAALLIAAAAVSVIPKNVIIHLDIERKEQSLVERWYLWDRALHVIKAKPLTGTGVNTYAVAHQKYDKTNNWRVKNYYAHNGYLQMAAEVGIPGLLLFLLFLLRWGGVLFANLSAWFKNPGQNQAIPVLAIGLGVLNFLVLALVDTVLHNPPSVKLFWYLSALALAYVPAKNKLDAGF